MATITILSGPDGPLTAVKVPLRPGRLPERMFYGCPDFMESLTKQLPTWETGALNSDKTPQEQMDNLLNRWITGREMQYGRQFKDLMPAKDEVWEMKTPDLRVFGWFYRPKVFVAALLDYADWYKGRKPKRSYEVAKNAVLKIREGLDLDAPKFATGEYDALV